MSRYFNIETDIAQNLINDFFSIYDCQGTIGSILSGKIFNDINHGYRLLSFFMTVATYCYYEKMRRAMNTAIVLHLFNRIQVVFKLYEDASTSRWYYRKKLGASIFSEAETKCSKGP